MLLLLLAAAFPPAEGAAPPAAWPLAALRPLALVLSVAGAAPAGLRTSAALAGRRLRWLAALPLASESAAAPARGRSRARESELELAMGSPRVVSPRSLCLDERLEVENPRLQGVRAFRGFSVVALEVMCCRLV